MELTKIESLLLQEMEEVKGGTTGVCQCESGAKQHNSPGGTCVCKSGAMQLDTTENVCICMSLSGQK